MAKVWCEVRQGDKSFWLQRDQLRRWAWSLVAEAADFGETLARHVKPFADAKSLDDATARYAAGAFEVDRAHRRFEQRRLALLESRLPHYGSLREVATNLRRAHRAWADQLCRDFARLCKDQGFLPSAELRQRNLFEQVVQALARATTSDRRRHAAEHDRRLQISTARRVEPQRGASQVCAAPCVGGPPGVMARRACSPAHPHKNVCNS
jgi:hypothetical protein